MFRLLTLSIAPLVLVACASAPSAPTATAAAAPAPAAQGAAPEQICTREYPTTSSTIAVTRCRTKEQIAAEQAAAKATSDAVRDNARVMRDPAASSR